MTARRIRHYGPRWEHDSIENKEIASFNLIPNSGAWERQQTKSSDAYSAALSKALFDEVHPELGLGPLVRLPYGKPRLRQMLSGDGVVNDFYSHPIDVSEDGRLFLCFSGGVVAKGIDQKKASSLLGPDGGDLPACVKWLGPSGVLVSQSALSDSRCSLLLIDDSIGKPKFKQNTRWMCRTIERLSMTRDVALIGCHKGGVSILDTRSHGNYCFLGLDPALGPVCSIKSQPGGGHMVAVGWNGNRVEVHDLRKCFQSSADPTIGGFGEPIFGTGCHQAAVKALAWHPNNRNLLLSGGGSNDKTVKLWDLGKSASSQHALARLRGGRFQSIGDPEGPLVSSLDMGAQITSACWISNSVFAVTRRYLDYAVSNLPTLEFFSFDENNFKVNSIGSCANSSNSHVDMLPDSIVDAVFHSGENCLITVKPGVSNSLERTDGLVNIWDTKELSCDSNRHSGTFNYRRKKKPKPKPQHTFSFYRDFK